MQIEPAKQQRLYEHLNNLFLNDINDYERTVSDVTFACDMARDYYGTVLLCGWQGITVTALCISAPRRRLRFKMGPSDTDGGIQSRGTTAAPERGALTTFQLHQGGTRDDVRLE